MDITVDDQVGELRWWCVAGCGELVETGVAGGDEL